MADAASPRPLRATRSNGGGPSAHLATSCDEICTLGPRERRKKLAQTREELGSHHLGDSWGPVDAGRSIKTRAARISSSQKFSRFAICPNVNNSHFNWNPCLFWILLAAASKEISALDDILQVKGNTVTNSACSIRFLQSLGVYTNLSGIRVHGRYPLTLTTQIIPVSMWSHWFLYWWI